MEWLRLLTAAACSAVVDCGCLQAAQAIKARLTNEEHQAAAQCSGLQQLARGIGDALPQLQAAIWHCITVRRCNSAGKCAMPLPRCRLPLHRMRANVAASCIHQQCGRSGQLLVSPAIKIRQHLLSWVCYTSTCSQLGAFRNMAKAGGHRRPLHCFFVQAAVSHRINAGCCSVLLHDYGPASAAWRQSACSTLRQ